jgi:hypothetical protein
MPHILFHEQVGTLTWTAALDERVQRLLDGAPGFLSTPVGRPVLNDGLRLGRRRSGAPGSPSSSGPTSHGRPATEFHARYVFVGPPAA